MTKKEVAAGQADFDQASEARAWQARARHWLRKSSINAKDWRAPQKKRVQSFVFIKAWNNAVRRGTRLPGLRHWSMATLPSGPPTGWPVAKLCANCGPDIVASVHFLQRHPDIRLNLDYIPDVNHLSWNSFKGALRDVGLWRHTLLILMMSVMKHGPFHQAQRLKQCMACLREYLDLARPSDDPLFAAMLPRILNDTGRLGEMGRHGIDAEIWQSLADCKPWKESGSPCNLTKWFHIIRQSRCDDATWYSQALAQVYCCIECDLLHGKKFQRMLADLRLKVGIANDDEARPLMREEAPEQKTLTQSCQNLLVVSTMVLCDPDNQYKQRLINCIAEPLQHWQAESNRELRSVDGSASWGVSQVRGDMLRMLGMTFGKLTNIGDLQHISLTIPQVGLNAPEDLDFESRRQGNLAVFFGELAVWVASNFLQRQLWLLRGWPAGPCLIASDNEQEARAAIDLLRDDWGGVPSPLGEDRWLYLLWGPMFTCHLCVRPWSKQIGSWLSAPRLRGGRQLTKLLGACVVLACAEHLSVEQLRTLRNIVATHTHTDRYGCGLGPCSRWRCWLGLVQAALFVRAPRCAAVGPGVAGQWLGVDLGGEGLREGALGEALLQPGR